VLVVANTVVTIVGRLEAGAPSRYVAARERWRAPPIAPTQTVQGPSSTMVFYGRVTSHHHEAHPRPAAHRHDPRGARDAARAAPLGRRRSVGAIVDLLARLQRATPAEQDALLAAVRAAPVAHREETGWREGGWNGYLWALATPGPQAVRYDAYDRSRAGAVAAGLRAGFPGVLGADFYGGYNGLAVTHQRCGAHLRRDLHKLTDAHADDPAVRAWATDGRALYDRAQERLRGPTPPTRAQRAALYRQLEDRAHARGLRHAGVAHKGHPCHALCHRLLRHQRALFQFVRVPGLAADNNLAERAIRPRAGAQDQRGHA